MMLRMLMMILSARKGVGGPSPSGCQCNASSQLPAHHRQPEPGKPDNHHDQLDRDLLHLHLNLSWGRVELSVSHRIYHLC